MRTVRLCCGLLGGGKGCLKEVDTASSSHVGRPKRKSAAACWIPGAEMGKGWDRGQQERRTVFKHSRSELGIDQQPVTVGENREWVARRVFRSTRLRLLLGKDPCVFCRLHVCILRSAYSPSFPLPGGPSSSKCRRASPCSSRRRPGITSHSRSSPSSRTRCAQALEAG